MFQTTTVLILFKKKKILNKNVKFIHIFLGRVILSLLPDKCIKIKIKMKKFYNFY